MLTLVDLNHDLIEQVIAELQPLPRPDLSATTIVFPSQRLTFFFRQRLADEFDQPYFPPRLLTVDALFDFLHEFNFPGFSRIGEMEATYHVFRCLPEVFTAGVYAGGQLPARFGNFFSWALKLWQAVEELLVEGSDFATIDADKFACFAELGDYHQPYKTFIHRLPALIQRFLLLLETERKSTRGSRYHRLAGLAENGSLLMPPVQNWIFAGMNALNASERKLLRHIFANTPSRLILKTDPAALSQAASPFNLHLQTIRDLQLEPPVVDRSQPVWNRFADKVFIYPTANVEAEMVQIHDIVKTLVSERSETDLKRIGVVLPDPSSLIPFVQGVVSRLDMAAGSIPFNITLGYPFPRTPLFQLIDALLRTRENRQPQGLAVTDYLDLIRHPYVKLSANDPAGDPLRQGIHQIESLICQENLLWIEPEAMEERLAASLGQAAVAGVAVIEPQTGQAIVAEIRRLHQRFLVKETLDLAGLVAFLKAALNAITPSGPGGGRGYLFLNEYLAAGQAILDELLDFAEAPATAPAMAGADFIDLALLIRRHFNGRQIQFQGSPLKGIQVMGMLEFRGLQFDEVIIADALEGILPESRKYDPLLPYDIRRLFGIRGHPDWEKLFAANFFSLIGSARRVHILYPQQPGGGVSGEAFQRSRFLERIVYETEKERGQWRQTVNSSLTFAVTKKKLQRIVKSPAVREKLTAMTYSPSALESFIKCPVRFYWVRVMGLEERPEPQSEADAGVFGSIVHLALKTLCQGFVSQRRSGSKKFNVAAAAINQAVDSSYREHHFSPDSGSERIRHWVLLQKLREFITDDLGRLREKNIRIIGLEKKISVTLMPGDPDQATRFTGTIDRLEAEGKLRRIIDYKTGSSPRQPRIGAGSLFSVKDLYRLDEREYTAVLQNLRKAFPGFQLLLYTAMLRQHEGLPLSELDAEYLFLKERVERRTVLPETAAEKEDLMNHFMANLQEVLTDLRRRETFIPNPRDENYCSACPFRTLCGNY